MRLVKTLKKQFRTLKSHLQAEFISELKLKIFQLTEFRALTPKLSADVKMLKKSSQNFLFGQLNAATSKS